MEKRGQSYTDGRISRPLLEGPVIAASVAALLANVFHQAEFPGISLFLGMDFLQVILIVRCQFAEYGATW